MESLSLVQIGDSSFQNSVATLVGVDDDIGDGCAEDNLKEIFMLSQMKYKFKHRTQGIFLNNFMLFIFLISIVLQQV